MGWAVISKVAYKSSRISSAMDPFDYQGFQQFHCEVSTGQFLLSDIFNKQTSKSRVM